MSEQLTPPDPVRCQVEISTQEGSFMTLGPRAWKTRRCENPPVHFVREREAKYAGKHGSMTVCGPCFKVMQSEMDMNAIEVLPIAECPKQEIPNE